MAKPPAARAPGAPGPRAGRPKPQPLRVDPEKYPHVERNPALERALRIRQALDQGKPRDEAVRLAEQAMGPRAPVMQRARPAPAGRPSSGPRPGGKAERPRRKAAAPARPSKGHR